MRFETCIRDEMGYIVAWTVGMSNAEIEETLNQHPEWYLSTEKVDC